MANDTANEKVNENDVLIIEGENGQLFGIPYDALRAFALPKGSRIAGDDVEGHQWNFHVWNVGGWRPPESVVDERGVPIPRSDDVKLKAQWG